MAGPPEDLKIPEDHQQNIIRALDQAGATGPCPRCANRQFSLIGGYFNLVLHRNVSTIELAGHSVPIAAVACTRCGWLALHAIGVLGLMAQARGEAQVAGETQK